MKSVTELMKEVAQTVEKEVTMERNIDELEEAAIAAEKDSMPELGRILVLHADVMRGVLERSRRFWMRLSSVLGAALLSCLLLLALLIFAGR